MLQLLKFELKKYKKQYKILTLFILIFSFVSITLSYRYINQNRIAEKQVNYTEDLQTDIGNIEYKLRSMETLEITGDKESKQLEYVVGSGQYMFQLRNAIYQEDWYEIPRIKQKFLEQMGKIEETGGEISGYYGKSLELEIEKNNLLLKNDLAYEDDEYSTLPQLILYNISKNLFSIGGIILIILLFGLSFSEDYEDKTISTLKTQPITMKNILLTKITSMILILIIYMLFVLILGFFIPFLFRRDIGLNYPIIYIIDGAGYILSAGDSIFRLMAVFFSFSIFSISIVLFVSVLTKNKFQSIIISAGIFLLGIVLTNNTPSLKTSFNPFFGLEAEKLMVGGYREILQYSLFTIFISIGIIIISVLLLNKEGINLSGDKKHKRFSNKKTSNLNTKRKVIIFENRKSKRNKRIKNVIILSILLTLILSSVLNFQSQKVEIDYILRLEERLENAYVYKDRLISKRKEIETGKAKHIKDTPEEFREDAVKDGLESYDDSIETNNLEIDMLIKTLNGYEAGDFNKILDYQIYIVDSRLEALLDMYDDPANLGGYYNPMPESALKVAKSQYEIISERKLKPLTPGEYLITTWVDYKPDKLEYQQLANQVVEENEKYDSSGLYSLYLFYNKYIYILPIILLIFLKGLGFNNEIGKKKPLNFIRTQPIKLGDIYNGKIINGLSNSFVFISIIIIVIILSGTVLNRFGDLDYPILSYDIADAGDVTSETVNTTVDGNYHFIDLGIYLLKASILTLGSIGFLLTLTSLISNIVKNKLFTMILSTIIISLGYLISATEYTKLTFLSPFIYLNIPKIINGEMAWKLNNGNLNFLYGIIVLVISSLICWILGNKSSKLYERS